MNLLGPILDLHYAQWMMIAGGVLVVIGFFGFALYQNRNLPPEAEDARDSAPEQHDQSRATDSGFEAKNGTIRSRMIDR